MFTPILTEDFADTRQFLKPNMTVWDNNGWAIRAGNSRREALVWTSPYLLRSPASGPYIVRDSCTWQTMIIDVARPNSLDADMKDNDFESEGWFNGDLRPSSDLKIKPKNKGGIVWSVGSSSVSCSPPDWRIRAATISTKVDIDIHTPYPSRKIDTSLDLGAGKHWHTVIADAKLKLTEHNKQFAMDGFAFHERHTHAKLSFNPSDIQRGEGIWWFTAAHSSLKLFVLMRPSMNIANAWLITKTGSEEIHGTNLIAVKQTRQWADPRSHLLVPSGWELSIKTNTGLLTARIWAQARAYYVWGYLSRAYNLLYWWLANGTVSYRDKTGEPHRLVTRNFVHSNRVLIEKGLKS